MVSDILLGLFVCGTVVGLGGLLIVNQSIKEWERALDCNYNSTYLPSMNILNSSGILPFTVHMSDSILRFIDRTSSVVSIVPVAFHDKLDRHRYVTVTAVLALDHWHRCYNHANDTTFDELQEAVISVLCDSCDRTTFQLYRDMILLDRDKILEDYEDYI